MKLTLMEWLDLLIVVFSGITVLALGLLGWISILGLKEIGKGKNKDKGGKK